MTYHTLKTSTPIKAKVLAASVLLSLAGSAHSPPVRASGIPVVDGLNNVFNMTIDEARQQAMRKLRECFDVKNLKEAMKRVEDIQKIDLRTTVNGQTIKLSDAMPEVPPMQGADIACPDPSGGTFSATGASSIRDALGLSSSDLNGANLREEQHRICRTLVYMRNSKWNAERKVVLEMERQTDQLKEILGRWNSKVGGDGGSISGDITSGCSIESDGGATEGWQASALAELQANAEQSERLFKQVQTEVNVYQNVINTLEHRQSDVGRQLLAGQEPSGFVASVAEDLVQGAVLKAALEVGTGDCGDELGVRCD